MSEPFALTQCKVVSSDDFAYLEGQGKLGDWTMEPKIDGWRIQADVTSEDTTLWTRTGKSATGKMPLAEAQLRAATQGRHTFRLDCEACWVDPESGEPDYILTGSALGSGVDVCVMKQRERGALTLFVFDILEIDGHDIRGKRLAHRKDVLQRYLGDSSVIRLVIGEEPSFEQHTRNFVQYKEGSVIKQLASLYAGKRHKSWLKWKEMETLDVRIIGYKPGQGKFEGLVGAIEWQAPDGTKGFCSGMDDSTRVYISDNRQTLLGQTIEIKHFGKLVDGYRHPQFLRFRLDK